MLTRMQVKVCTLVSRGMADKQIAGELKLSESGVRHHLRILFRKGRVHTRTELVLWFLFLSPASVDRLNGRLNGHVSPNLQKKQHYKKV
jgi:DNA-binding CsgD family transcriptional regulator